MGGRGADRRRSAVSRPPSADRRSLIAVSRLLFAIRRSLFAGLHPATSDQRIANSEKRPATSEKLVAPAAPSGFTIVEILIVLAIAGLILLMVFEAIPALERSSRNSQRKQDVSALLQGVAHYELDNSGDFPLSLSLLSPYVPHLNYYSLTPPPLPTPPYITLVSTPQATTAPETYVDEVVIYEYQLCSSTTPGATTDVGADYSDVVALYALETGGAPASECQQL